MSTDLKIEFIKVVGEVSIIYYDKLKNKLQYNSYCDRIKHTISSNGILSVSQVNMLSHINDALSTQYGLPDDIISDLVSDFFMLRLYQGIYEHQRTLNNYFNNI